MLYSSKAKSMSCAFLLLVQFLKGKKKSVNKGEKVAITSLSIWVMERVRIAHCGMPSTSIRTRDSELPCAFLHGMDEEKSPKARQGGCFMAPETEACCPSRVNQSPTMKAQAQWLERVRHSRKLSHNDTHTEEVLTERSPASIVEQSCA